MKYLITAALLILIWGAPAGAAEKLLTEQQLDGITAGTGGENSQQSLHDNSLSNSVDSANVTNDIRSDNHDAVSVVNIPNTNVDNSVDAGQNVNSRNKKLELNSKAQESAKAVNITNAIDSKVGTGVNVHANGLHPSGSSGGSLNNLYQSNTIINNN